MSTWKEANEEIIKIVSRIRVHNRAPNTLSERIDEIAEDLWDDRLISVKQADEFRDIIDRVAELESAPQELSPQER